MNNITDFSQSFYNNAFHLSWTNPSGLDHIKIYIDRYQFIDFGPDGAVDNGAATTFDYTPPVFDSYYFSIYCCNADESEVSSGYFAKILCPSILMGNLQDCTIGPGGHLYIVAGDKLIIIKLSVDRGTIRNGVFYTAEKYRKVTIY